MKIKSVLKTVSVIVGLYLLGQMIAALIAAAS